MGTTDLFTNIGRRLGIVERGAKALQDADSATSPFSGRKRKVPPNSEASNPALRARCQSASPKPTQASSKAGTPTRHKPSAKEQALIHSQRFNVRSGVPTESHAFYLPEQQLLLEGQKEQPVATFPMDESLCERILIKLFRLLPTQLRNDPAAMMAWLLRVLEKSKHDDEEALLRFSLKG